MNSLLIKKMNFVNLLIIFVIFSLIFFSSYPVYPAQEKKKTFGEIKKELLEKQVYIYGKKFKKPSFRGEDILMGWEIVQKYGDEKSGYSYKRDSLGNYGEHEVPYSLKGSKGIIESISIYSTSFDGKRKETSAFGEKITDDDVLNPYFSVVVRLNNGTLVSHKGYYSTIGTEVKLASKVDSEREEIEKNINSIVGKVIYPVASADIYPSQTDLDTMVDISRRKTVVLYKYDLLTPLKIIRAKHIESEQAFLLELDFGNGETAVTLIDKYYSFDRKLNPKDYWDNLILKGGFFEKMLSASGFVSVIPKFLTKKEIAAIKKRSIFKGMSESALWLSWGYNYKRNDWGIGGDQYIYGDTQYVYVKNGKIVNWQSLQK
jgi:hypothetical protein